MASPYRPSAATAAAATAGGFVQLTEADYATFQQLVSRIPVIDNTAAQIPAKVYEPTAVAGELLFTSDGDCLVSWGGSYAS